MKKVLLSLATILLTLGFAFSSGSHKNSQKKDDKAAILCPISGEKADKDSFLQLKGGQKIFFCCGGCKSSLLKNPAKYIKKK